MVNGRGSSNHRLPSASSFQSRICFMMLSMFAAMASLYVAGRLWQDATNRVHLIEELDRRTGQGHSAISVDDTLKIINCREQQKKLVALQTELEKARTEGFVSNYFSENSGTHKKKKLLAVVGIFTRFGRKTNRDAIRKAWMPAGTESFPLVLLQRNWRKRRASLYDFANRGDISDKDIDNENRQTSDFIILNDHLEAPKESSKKAKLFFAHAVENWNAEFYVKVNDDIYINIDALGAALASHLDKSRVYIGCMKSGEVFSQPSQKWYEPEWWKFGDGKSYFLHASGEIFAISHPLAHFILINRSILRTYAHDDVSAGSWFIGLDVKHVDEGRFCCSSWSSGSVCAAS
ncbi:hydroxyproline O-galactosyltransferase HPGT1-like isoform X1 [Coffea arabica]|uniref:Hexosyltransferase n=1 Tax=Coffea arabica TaxID=13443 RepID=A0ABM4VHZ4_COFAR